ncbi:MAG TPA: tetratricopeptide repeat protein [Pirellulales bacterium]|nr:tetratricopeptide repeat protein [Pirellulales bacterium]
MAGEQNDSKRRPSEPGAGVVVEQQRDKPAETNSGQERENETRRGQAHQGERDCNNENHHKKGSENDQSGPGKKNISTPNWKTLLITGTVALVCGAAGAWGYLIFFDPAKSAVQDQGAGKKDAGDEIDGNEGGGTKGGGNISSEGKSRSEEGSSEGGVSASDIPGFNSAADAQAFEKELEHLAHRIDLLGSRIDRITQPQQEPPALLHTLQMQMTDLERAIDPVANLPSKLRQLEQRFSSLKEDFKTLKDQVSGEDVPTVTKVAPAEGGFSAPGRYVDADPANEATLKLAIARFREGHYAQARELLHRLQYERPNDARVWYYAALANGLASGKWDGETKRLVDRGIERERAGTPLPSVIDGSLAGLTREMGQDWLATQRRQANLRK